MDGGGDGDDADIASKESAVVTPTTMATLVATNLVSRSEATQLAVAFAKARLGQALPVVASTDVSVDDRTGDAQMYAINFKGGGFVVVSADKRQTPLLAFSATGNFEIQSLMNKLAPEGVRSFALRARQLVHDIRTGAVAPISNAQEFDRLSKSLSTSTFQPGDASGNFIVPGPGNCTGSYSHTYTTTFNANWNQDCGWNAGDPFINGGPCGHAWAGCVAVAVGQVMKYWAYPYSFDWGSMSDTSPTMNAALLLRDIGNRLDMDWGADGSSAHTEDVDDVLESYGYSSSASYTESFYGQMPGELQAGRPVIMKGTPDCDFLGIQTCGGHAFVVVGVYDAYDCGTGTASRHYQINWGWGGQFNGWYISLNPGGNNFNYHQGVVLGIKPW